MIYLELSKIIINSSFKASGVSVGYGVPYIVKYCGETVGEYYADLVVEGRVIVELKSEKVFSGEHTAQILNYLHISGCKLGYLLNFQNRRFEFKRFVLGA